MSEALPPGSTVGILGGGQLGRMLAMAAARLGLRCHVYSDASGPAFDVAARSTVGRFDDWDALRAFGREVDVATIEFENVPAAALAAVGESTRVHPPPRAVEVSQDRLAEKEFLAARDIAVAPYRKVDSLTDLEIAVGGIGLPALLKTRRLGYDGKGQVGIGPDGDLRAAWRAVGQAPCLLEGLLTFETELSVLVARTKAGVSLLYDPSRNRHESGILAEARVPAEVPVAAIVAAREIARQVARTLDYVGVLCVEMFYLGAVSATPLVVNEIAPRVHNSGHWTLDACVTSQFENHIRAVAGWPLGSVERHSDAVMTNLIGADAERWLEFAARSGTALHLYGKNEARPGRKMGHVTRLAPRKV